jgi:TolA-binding protein
MRKILILLWLIAGCYMVFGQRSVRFESAERLFYEAKEFFELQNYPGCIDKLEAYKKQSGNNDLIQEVDYMLAFIAFEQGRGDALDILETYLENYPDTRHRNEISFLIGSAYFSQGMYESALHWLNESDLDRLGLEQQEAYAFRMAYSLLQTGRLEQARGYFLRVQQIGTTYREASSYYLAYIDYATGRYDSALSEFLRLRNHPLYSEMSLYYIAQIYYIQNQYERVISSGEELLRLYPAGENNVEVYRILGNAYYQQGNQAKALEFLRRYVDSTSAPMRGELYLLGLCYYNLGDCARAIDAFSGVVTVADALSQNANLHLGQCFLKQGNKNNARMSFERAATATFDRQVQETAMYNYALLIHETGFTGFGESVTIFENFLNNFPNSQYADKVNDYLVEVYLTTKNYESALTSINKIRNPGQSILDAKQNVLFQLGAHAFTNQEPGKAIDYFNQAIAMGVRNREAYYDSYFWRGESQYRQNEFSRAAADFQSYLGNANRQTETYLLASYNLGYSYFKQRNYTQALTAFRQYVNAERNTSATSLADAYNRIGDCLFFSRQYAAADENYSRAASLQPSAGDYAIYQRGFVLGLRNDLQGKIAMMDRLIREFPNSQYIEAALYEKGRSYVLLETYNMAANAFNQLLTDYPQSSFARKAGHQLGMLYFNSNQLERSVEAYKQVISRYPGSEEAKLSIQDLRSVYIEMNDIGSYAAYVNSLGGAVNIQINEQDSLTYIAAERLFLRGDNEGAQRSLRSYLNSFPRGAFSSNANYYLGTIAFQQRNFTEAKQRFEAVLASGNPTFREDALARKAEIEYLDRDYVAAMSTFRQLIAVAESADNRNAARLGLMRSAQYTGQHRDALQAAEDLLSNARLSPEVETEARSLRAKSYIALNEPARAEADLVVLSKDLRTVHGAEAKYLLGQLYFNRNEPDKAEKEMMDFIQKGTTHQYWMARGFILLADVFMRKGDAFQARQYLTNLQNNYKGNDDIAGLIEERLSKLR